MTANRVKQCSWCREEKLATLDFFLKRVRNKDGLTGFCRTCHNQASSKWRKTWRLRKHGVPTETLLAKCDSRCMNPGCRKPLDQSTVTIDHDHQCCPGRYSCGKCIRGVLCRTCNSSLGFAQDSAEILRGLAAYVELISKFRVE